MRNVRRLLVILAVGVVVSAPAASAETLSAAGPAEQSSIPVLPGLETQVEFWKRIFTTYSTRQVVIHDALYLDRIYETLDFGPLVDGGLSDAEVTAYATDKVRDEKERVRAILMRLHQLGPTAPELSDEERKIGALFAGVKEASPFLDAAEPDRVRAQWGLRERFAAGVEVSRRYLPEMEAIFRREGLPLELTRLPLVESSFNVRAYSKVGAAGVWQFMPTTARLYMRLDNAVDERRDPIISTAAAAEHLKANYAVLGSWPLALTAYNHGRAGMVHAVSSVGSTDLIDIIQRYHGPGFKFASRNFYAEFLAALDVEQHFQDYFGELHPHRALHAETVVVPDYVNMKTLAHVAKTDIDELAELNPALSRAVIAGKLHVPQGYRLRVPMGAAAGFTTRFASLPRSQRHSGQPALYVTHRVQRGQTLAVIAKRYRTTVTAIRRRNKLPRSTHLRSGQSLVIPAG